jgi:hypothetical protein
MFLLDVNELPKRQAACRLSKDGHGDGLQPLDHEACSATRNSRGLGHDSFASAELTQSAASVMTVVLNKQIYRFNSITV